MIVHITDEAEADLERVGDAIAEDNPARSMTFVRELVLRCDRLADMPRRFGLLAGHEQSGLRKLVHSGYLVFYRIDDPQITVVRILHGAMDYEKILFPDDR